MVSPGTNTLPNIANNPTPTDTVPVEPAAGAEAPKLSRKERNERFYQALSVKVLSEAGVELTPVEQAVQVTPATLKPHNWKQRRAVGKGAELSHRIETLAETAEEFAVNRHGIERNQAEGYLDWTPVTKDDVRGKRAVLEGQRARGEIDAVEFEQKMHHVGHPSSVHHGLHYRRLTLGEKITPREPGRGESQAIEWREEGIAKARAIAAGSGIRGRLQRRKVAREQRMAASIDWGHAFDLDNLIGFHARVTEATEAIVEEKAREAASLDIEIDEDAVREAARRTAWNRLAPEYVSPYLKKKEFTNPRIIPQDRIAALEDLIINKSADDLEAMRPQTEPQPYHTDQPILYEGVYRFMGETEPVMVTKQLEINGKKYVYVQGRATPIPEGHITKKGAEQKAKKKESPKKAAEKKPAEDSEVVKPAYTGVWRQKDGTEQPIIITGLAGEIGGRRYVTVKGSSAAIPEDEIVLDYS